MNRQEVALLAYMYDLSPWTATNYLAHAERSAHRGDCSLAEHKGPITCDKCVTVELRARLKFARKVLRSPSITV